MRGAPADVSKRARAVLWRAEGLLHREIMDRARVTRPTVAATLARYEFGGTVALLSKPPASRTSRYLPRSEDTSSTSLARRRPRSPPSAIGPHAQATRRSRPCSLPPSPCGSQSTPANRTEHASAPEVAC
ncbi:helix-turn-helix domain-containing protein [Pseudonocardia sp. GCM10023141]|uniref:helix-turn-helix domain-containing protein n=1 Tax=Pseudonocardia sp. GCM10023141 TaxID=3252653 RepID=UPI0036235AFE